MTLGRVDVIILLGCFAGYIFDLIRHTLKQNRQSSDEEVDEIPPVSYTHLDVYKRQSYRAYEQLNSIFHT